MRRSRVQLRSLLVSYSVRCPARAQELATGNSPPTEKNNRWKDQDRRHMRPGRHLEVNDVRDDIAAAPLDDDSIELGNGPSDEHQ